MIRSHSNSTISYPSISDISANSSSRMRFTTLGSREAAGLKGPGAVIAGCGGSGPTAGVSRDGLVLALAAAANRSRPLSNTK